jgi:hypothetical protein
MIVPTPFLQAAIDEVQQGLAEGGIPIGSVIVHRGAAPTALPVPACPVSEVRQRSARGADTLRGWDRVRCRREPAIDPFPCEVPS